MLHLAECQLATVEELSLLKRTSRTRISRHQRIADKHIDMIRQWKVLESADLMRQERPKYSRLIEELSKSPLKLLAECAE